jgi:hypothetical protein
MPPSGKESQFAVFANHVLQEGHPAVDGNLDFPDSAKKKQYASRKEQKELQQKESLSASDVPVCKQHEWRPSLTTKDKVGITQQTLDRSRLHGLLGVLHQMLGW